MSELYALTFVTADNPNRIIGECFFVFDTPEMAKDFANTDPKFIKDFRVTNMKEWQQSDKWRDAYETTFIHASTRYNPAEVVKLIIHPVFYNPNNKE